jgi:small subunit ribosomal protein S19
MSRSKWKGPVVCFSFFKKTPAYFALKSYSRKSEIPSVCLKKRIHVHTGSKFRTIVITSKMIGLKLGEFALTKKRGLHVSKLKLKKTTKAKKGVKLKIVKKKS